MKHLLVDTTLSRCTVALAENGKVVVEAPMAIGGGGHAEALLPAIEVVRQQAGIELAALDGLVTCIGPGSFTGIRTGLAVCRGLALALQRPLWGILTTAALAHGAARAGIPTAAVIDAYRGEVYFQVFAAAIRDGDLGPAADEPRAATLAAAPGLLPPGPLTLAGSGTRLLAMQPDWGMSAGPEAPTASSLAILGREAAAGWQPGQPLPPPPVPVYVRPADAALPSQAQPHAALRVHLAPAGTGDLETLARLHAEAFVEGWNAAALGALMAMPGALALLAADPDGQPAGFLLARLAADEVEIITLAVRPRLRRLRVASALLDAMHSHMAAKGGRQAFLEVAAGNAGAQALYGRFGYREVGRRPGYYGAGREEAVVMRADIASSAAVDGKKAG